MVELREKIALIVEEAESPFGMDESINGRAVADAILAIPEIRDALETSANLRSNQERQRRIYGGGESSPNAFNTNAFGKPPA